MTLHKTLTSMENILLLPDFDLFLPISDKIAKQFKIYVNCVNCIPQ